MKRKFLKFVFIWCLLLLINESINSKILDSCETQIYSIKDTMGISVIHTKYCECDNGIFSNGYMIKSTNYSSDKEYILWGQADGIFYNCNTLAFTVDIDKNGIDELITLFIDESNVYGYCHQFGIKDNHDATINTITLQPLLTEDPESPDEYYKINPDNSVSIFGKKYEGGENIVIYTNENKILVK